jgi:hypothetical protein
MNIPDAIEFLGQRQGGEFNIPGRGRQVMNEQALNWMPLIRQIVVGPGSSGLLASAFINQARKMAQGKPPAAIIDLDAIDDGIEAMLEELE